MEEVCFVEGEKRKRLRISERKEKESENEEERVSGDLLEEHEHIVRNMKSLTILALCSVHHHPKYPSRVDIFVFVTSVPFLLYCYNKQKNNKYVLRKRKKRNDLEKKELHHESIIYFHCTTIHVHEKVC
jgi:uncharacterized membrane protein YkgB